MKLRALFTKENLRDPRTWVFAAALLFALVGMTWGLPCSDSWTPDSISPRACGLGAIAETYTPGHFHQYPPLHMLVLTILSLPEIAIGAARAGSGHGALEASLIRTSLMTPIELTARIAATLMFLGVVWNTMRLWERLLSRRAGVAAGAVVAVNATLVYYAHTGNLEVPYLFWSTLALLELDRVIAGEARERRFVLAMVAAVLTKDQAAGIFLLTLPVVAIFARELLRRRRLWTSLAWGALGYALLSGALVNPTGFAKRVSALVGPASQSWAQYPATLDGRIAMLKNALLAIPGHASWPIAAAAVVGVGIAMRPLSASAASDASTASPASPTKHARLRRLLPLLGAASFTLLFTLGARRTEDRFLLPQSVLFFPYAAVLFEAWTRGATRARTPRAMLAACAIACVVAIAPALLSVATMDGSLLADARYDAEAFLRALPAGTRIEVYGGPHFLPRLPPELDATRVGTDNPDDRSRLPGLHEVRARPDAIAERAPEYVVLSAEFSHDWDVMPSAASQFGVTSYHDDDAFRFFHDLVGGAYGYHRVLQATCELPWGACRMIHDATGTQIWIYAR